MMWFRLLRQGLQQDVVMVVAGDGRVLFLDAQDFSVVREERTDPELNLISAAAVSPDGGRLALAASNPTSTTPIVVCSSTEPANTVPAPLETAQQRNLMLDHMQRSPENARTQTRRSMHTAPERVAAEAAEQLKVTLARRQEKMKRKKAARKRRQEQRDARRRARMEERIRLGLTQSEVMDDEDSESEESSSDSDASTVTHGSAARAGGDGSGHQDIESKTVTAVNFSSDGSLLAAGTVERLLTITDPARPHMGPLAQFLAYGEVTAVSCGPGVYPWSADDSDDSDDEAGQKGGEESLDADNCTAWSIFSGGRISLRPTPRPGWPEGGPAPVPEAAEPGVGGAGTKLPSLGNGPQRLQKHVSSVSGTSQVSQVSCVVPPDEVPVKLRRMAGNGQGCVGVVVAGDSTGAVYILQLQDVLRISESSRQKELQAEIERRWQNAVTGTNLSSTPRHAPPPPNALTLPSFPSPPHISPPFILVRFLKFYKSCSLIVHVIIDNKRFPVDSMRMSLQSR